MSSKQKKNFDFDKKIPKPKKTEGNPNDHKAIKENVQDEPIQEKEEETNQNNIIPPKDQGDTFMLTQVDTGKDVHQNNGNIEEIKEEGEKKEEKFYSEREEYLKSKLEKMPVPDTVIKGVTKGIHKTNLSIHDDIANNNLIFAEHSRQISEILEKSINKSKISSSNNDIYSKYTPEVISYLKHLKQDEENIQSNIVKIEQNAKLLENESVKGIRNSIIETNIKNTQIKSLRAKKENLLQKLQNIAIQIEAIISAEKPDKNITIKEFLANFERDKEILEEKRKAYEEQRNKIKEKIMNDLNMSKEKKEKEYEQKIQEEEQKKKELIQERIKSEREKLIKRKQEIDEKMQKTKECIYNKLDKSQEDYLYFQRQKKFLEEENQKNLKLKMMKKEPLVSKEELEDLNNRIKEHHEQIYKTSIENTNLRKEMWKNRSQVLPTYKSPIIQIIENEEIQKKQEEQKIKEQKKLMLNEAKEYEANIPKPIISPKLKKSRENRLVKMDRNNILMLQSKNKRKQFLLDIPKPKVKRAMSPTIAESINNNNYVNNTEINNILSKKPKRFTLPKHTLHPRPEKPIDYLAEIRKSREGSTKRKKELNVKEFLSTESNTNLIEGIQLAKNQTEVLDNKLYKKKELMEANGGYSKNPELGNEIGSMLVQSIHAKLDILKAFN